VEQPASKCTSIFTAIFICHFGFDHARLNGLSIKAIIAGPYFATTCINRLTEMGMKYKIRTKKLYKFKIKKVKI